MVPKDLRLEWSTQLTLGRRIRATVLRKHFYIEGVVFALIVLAAVWLLYAFLTVPITWSTLVAGFLIGLFVYGIGVLSRILLLDLVTRQADPSRRAEYIVKDDLIIVRIGQEEVRMPIAMVVLQTVGADYVSLSRKKIPTLNEVGIFFDTQETRSRFVEIIKATQSKR